MRQLDGSPLDPDVADALDAIDATLAGDPVDPRYAELAELALLLADQRPRPSTEFTAALDQRMERRFAPAPRQPGAERPRRSRRWLWTPAAGLAVAVAVAIVIVFGGTSSPSSAGPSLGTSLARNGSSHGYSAASGAPAHEAIAPTKRTAAAPAPGAQSLAATGSAKSLAATGSAKSLSATGSAQSANSATSGASGLVQLPANGRKIIQGAQLSLSTSPRRIEDVAQEVFIVVGQFRGIVSNSTVTATGGPGGYAQFQLSIPSGSMPQAMAALSSLRFARVVSRTDTTQDVNGQYQGDVNRLAADRAVRTSLLKQLANAITQGQIDSLTIRIHDINAAIAADQATLQGLTNQVNYSQVTVTVNGGTPVPTPISSQSGGGGFSLHQAVHDAGRVLTVAAGVALIGVAALAPIALLVLLGWWIAAAVRRRRREQALDLV